MINWSFPRKGTCKPSFLFSGLVLLFLSGTVLTGCKNDLSKLPPDVNVKDLDNDRATDVTYIFSENGIVKGRLHTKNFVGNDKSKPPYMDFLNGVKLELFDDSMRIKSTVTAKNARYYTQERNIIARDSVVVKNSKGEKLQTEELIWNQKLERFYTEKFVRITYKNEISWGDGLEANQDFSWFRIKKQRGAIPVENGDLPLE